MKSRFIKWGLVVAVLLLLLWWLLRTLGPGKQPSPAEKELPLTNTQPAIPLPLSNVPQGVLGPPTKEEVEQEKKEREEAETPPPPPAPVLFPLKKNVPAATKPKPQVPTVKTASAQMKHLSSEEQHLIRLAMKAQPPLTPTLTNLLSVNPKRAALAATHFISLSPADKHQIGLALKAEPLLATRLTQILVVDGQRAVRGAAHFNGLPSQDKNRIDQTLKAQPALVENLSKLILEPSKNPELASPLAGTHSKRRRRGGLDHEMEWWGYRCGVNAEKTMMIKDDDAWDQFRTGFPMPAGWTPEKEAVDPRLRRLPPVLPDVDFDKMMVVGVFLGKVQEGYRIAISTVTITSDHKTMNVDYGKTFPIPNPMAGTALNEPFDIMVIKRFDGDVYFWNKP